MATQKKQVKIGIDIGTDSVKVCRLIQGPQDIELTNVARVEIYPENVADKLADGVDEKINSASPESAPVFKKEKDSAEAEDKEKLAQKKEKIVNAIKKGVKEADIKERDVVSAVAGQSVIVRYIEMPHMSMEELAGAIKFEAEQYIPFDLANVELDYQVLEEKMEHAPDKMRILLVAAKTDLIKEHISILEGASLKPAVVDVDAFALINAFERIKSPDKEECVALINIGHSLTNINILRGGVPYFTRDVFLAGKDITEALAKNFGLEFSQAEKLKRERGNVTESDAFNKALHLGMEELVGEIRLSFDYYENQATEKNISHVFLTGGTSLLPQIDKFLSESLGITVEAWDPFKDLKISGGVKEWEKVAPTLAVSLGLALHVEK